jgi:uncharacterized protein YndB with AHSA1/START domain
VRLSRVPRLERDRWVFSPSANTRNTSTTHPHPRRVGFGGARPRRCVRPSRGARRLTGVPARVETPRRLVVTWYASLGSRVTGS